MGTRGGSDRTPRWRWLRGLASGMALAAGAIHVAQVGVHLNAGWAIAGFFLVVGTVQVIAAGLLLLRAWPAIWLWFGIVGSAAVIAIWLMTRTVGPPFGSEAGQAEAVGTADAAASLAEAITIVVLALWVRDRSAVRGRGAYVAAVLVVASLGVAWAAARSAGLFDPDPRATIALPQLADRAALILVAGVALMLGMLGALPASPPSWWPALMHGLLTAILVAGGGLVLLTLPAAGGQNASCTYGPLADLGDAIHSGAPRAARLADDDERWFAVLLLSACGTASVRLESAEVVNSRGPAEVVAYALLPVGERLAQEGARALPADSRTLDSQPALQPGEQRQLVVLLRGGGGLFSLDSLRIGYRVGDEAGTLAFAVVLSTCSPSRCGADYSGPGQVAPPSEER